MTRLLPLILVISISYLTEADETVPEAVHNRRAASSASGSAAVFHIQQPFAHSRIAHRALAANKAATIISSSLLAFSQPDTTSSNSERIKSPAEMPDQKEFRTLHSVPLQSQSAVVQESSRIPKAPLWVRHSPTHSKHKFTIVNYGQSEQVMRQFFKGSNGGKPYVTPEPTDTTSTEANILDRREAREIAERIIKEELNRAKVAKFGKAATGNYEENETERGGEALQVEQSGYSGDRRTQYDWSFTNNNVQEFPNGYDGLSALPEHEASISDRVISNKLTEEQPVPTVTPPPAPTTTPSAQLLFTTPVSDVDLQKLCATLPAAGTAPAPAVGQAGPRVIEYAIRKTVDGALTGGSPAFGCRPCEGRNSEPSPFQALPAVAPLPSTQQPLPVPVPPAPQPSPSSSAPKRIPAPAPFDDVSLLAPPRSTEGYVTGGATETAPVFAQNPTESDASKYGEPPPPPSYPSPGAPLPQPAVLSYPISRPNLVPPPTPVVAQASPSPPYPTLVTPPPAAPAPQQQQVYPSSINLAELPDPPYETEPPPAPPPPPPPPSAAPLPAPTTQTPSPAPTYAPYPQAPPAPPSYSESKSTASPSTSYVTQAPFTTSVQTTKPTTQGRTYSIVPTTVPTPPPVQPTTTTTSYVPPPIVEAPVGGEKDEAVSTYSQSNTMVYPLPKPSPPPSPPTPPPPPPPPRSTDPPAFVQVPASYSNIEEETSEPEVPEIVQPVPAPAYQTKSPEPKENNYVKPTNVQPKKESTPVESYVKEEQVEESTATAPATEDVVEGAESQKESYTSSSSQKVSYVPETAPQLPEEPEPEAEVELQTESSYNNLEEDHEQNVGPPTIIETEEKPKLPLVNEEAYLTNNRQKIQVKPSPYVDTPHPTLRPYPQRTIAPRPSLPIESYQERFQPPPAPVLQPQPRPLQPIPLPAQPQLPYTAPIQSYQPFQPVQPAPYHPIPYQTAPSYQSVPQGQQSCCGGQLFNQQGGLCVPMNFNACQQQYRPSFQQNSGCGSCSPSCPSACQQQSQGCGGNNCCQIRSPACCQQPSSSLCCNSIVQSCCQPQQQQCCNAQSQSCCPSPFQSCCCSQGQISGLCRRRNKRSIGRLLGLCGAAKIR